MTTGIEAAEAVDYALETVTNSIENLEGEIQELLNKLNAAKGQAKSSWARSQLGTAARAVNNSIVPRIDTTARWFAKAAETAKKIKDEDQGKATVGFGNISGSRQRAEKIKGALGADLDRVVNYVKGAAGASHDFDDIIGYAVVVKTSIEELSTELLDLAEKAEHAANL